jgi:hypothetical protein
MNGGVPTGFSDLSPVIEAGGTNEGTTNYVHLNGATNRARYYRVWVQPPSSAK